MTCCQLLWALTDPGHLNCISSRTLEFERRRIMNGRQWWGLLASIRYQLNRIADDVPLLAHRRLAVGQTY